MSRHEPRYIPPHRAYGQSCRHLDCTELQRLRRRFYAGGAMCTGSLVLLVAIFW